MCTAGETSLLILCNTEFTLYLGADNLCPLHHVGVGLLDGHLAEKGTETSETAPHKSQVTANKMN